MCAFRVTSPKQILEKIIPQFEKYNLITQKQADYLLFKEILNLIIKGEHLNIELVVHGFLLTILWCGHYLLAIKVTSCSTIRTCCL